jgi:AraC-type DNA-binding domain-containing proteins
MKNLHLITKSFLIISIFLVFPLVTMSLIYNYNVINYSEEEISRFATINLKNIKEMNELIIDSSNKDMARILLSSSFENLTQINNFDELKGNTDKILLVNQAVNQLKDIVYSNYRISSIDVYIKNADFVISSTGTIVSAKNFEDYDWLKNYYSRKHDYGESPSWVARKRSYGSETGNGKETDNSAGGTNVISYIYPLSSQPTKVDGIIILNLNEKQFSDLLNSSYIGGGDEYFYVIDNQGSVISHVDKKLLGQNIGNDPIISQIIKDDNKSGFFKQVIGGRKNIVTYYKSGNNDWIYLGVYPLDNLLQKANSLRSNLLFVVFLFIVVGILLSYFTSKRLYNPLENLVKDIKARKGIDLTGNESEMVLLSKAFNELSKQDDILNKRIESNKRSLEDAFLLSLIKGEDVPEGAGFDLEDFATDEMSYMCSVCTIDKYQVFESKYPKEEQYYCKMLFIGICQQFFNETLQCKGFILNRNHIVIILASTADNHIKEEFITEGLKKAQAELTKAFDISITVGLGSPVKGKSLIKDSFNEAENACRRRLLEGFGEIIKSDKYNEEASIYYYPYDVEKRILNKLSIGSCEEIYQELDSLSEELKGRENLSSDNVIQLFNQLVGNTIKYLVENNINFNDLYTDNFNIYMRLANRETMDDIIILLKDFYKRIVDSFAGDEIEDKQYIDRIMEYIKLHFTSELDIEKMVKYTGISYSYIRKIIKQETDKSVIDHINELRIEEAKKLLRQTNMKVSDIALSIGYNNDQSFSRFFKKIEGITPGEFRNIQLK